MIKLILFIIGSVFAVHPDYWGVGVVLLLSLCISVVISRKPNSKDNKKKTEQGDPQAQYSLGCMYESGVGVSQDYKEAVDLYRKSAEQGNSDAQYNLGAMYYSGQGVLQDYVMAHMYWNIASVRGDKDAIENRDRVEKMMTPSQIEKAKDLAREWLEGGGKLPSGSESQSIESQKITEDTAYEIVACELELGEQQIGLWTKAFADADGDENKQRSLYIKMRVAELTGYVGAEEIRSRPGGGLLSSKGSLGILGFLGGVLSLGYAITQIYAGFIGIDLYFGQGWASIAVGIAIFFMRFTLPITIGAFYCAMEVWHLPWGLAALFAAPGLAFLIPAVLQSLIGWLSISPKAGHKN